MILLKLDPKWPLVWRSPSSLQLGIDPPAVVLDNVTETQERMLSALAVGISDTGLGLLARGNHDEQRRLLEVVAPALATDQPKPARHVIAISGSGSTVESLARILAGSGLHTVVAERAEDLVGLGADLAVAVGHFVLPPALHALWLRRDVPHLPVVFGDSALVVGPLVEPGCGPCLRCLELARRDRDSAWPAVASQLLGRSSTIESAALSAEGAATAARILLRRLDGPTGDEPVETRIDALTGARTSRRVSLHPECGCRGVGHLVPAQTGATARRRESGWAAAVPLAPAPD